MFHYNTDELTLALNTNRHLVRAIRSGLEKGVDWIRRGKNEYRYSDSGLKKIRRKIIERDVQILDFVKSVECATEMRITEGNQTMIHLAMIDFLKEKGFKNYEIAKRLPYTEGTIQVMKARAKEDWTYKLIKQEIYKIGEKNNVKKP